MRHTLEGQGQQGSQQRQPEGMEQRVQLKKVVILTQTQEKFVLTSWFLLSQGRCCGKGCRHCPWPETAQRASKRDNVPAWPDKEMEQLALGAYEKEDKR